MELPENPQEANPSALPPYHLSLRLQAIEPGTFRVPVGISARHIHLSPNHLLALFGSGYGLQVHKPLSQPGQFAARETLTVVGPKGVLEGVRVLGPTRPHSQVEISRTDSYHLGIETPLRDSGDLEQTPGIVLVGPKGAVNLDQGLILAAAHIHMHPADATLAGLKNGERVQVLVEGERGTTFNNVLIRISPKFKLEFHLDTDEANAALLENGDLVEIVPHQLLM